MNNNPTNQPETLLEIRKSATDGAVSPVFAWLILLIFWVGVFAILSIDGEKDLSFRMLIATLLSLFIAIPGVSLFQSCELLVNTHFVKWESHVVPRLWVERWHEPIKNYKCISLKRSRPVLGIWPPKYCADRLLFPKKRTGDNISDADREFNKKTFVAVCLEHSTDPKKLVALRTFGGPEKSRIDDYCSSISDKLGIPVK